ncbi:MAG: hypothetical protein KDC38_05320, partial [Planctomycetes bacterium]|nr:hypothetical protein [Planctomycetota bacterium]
QCGRAAARLEELVASVSGIEREVREARAGDRLTQGLAEVDALRHALRSRRDEALLAKAGAVLVGGVITEHRERSQPRLFRRASELFRAFTQHRYELRVGEADPASKGDPVATFEAIDVTTGDHLATRALSSGTRTQLLLAVRLAFALESVRTATVPFFLDEVLSHSDPERSRAVAESLRHLVRGEGRQVFYLSCQPEEEILFRSIFATPTPGAESETDGLTVIDVARLRGADELDRAPLLPSPHPRELPSPALTPAAFARAAGVARFDMRRGLDAQHIFHLLVPDLELVRTLLGLGIETIGQLRSFSVSDGIESFLDDEQRARVHIEIRVACEFERCWRVGRGRPIDRRALAEAGVRGRYLDSLTDLADTLNGDPDAFLQALDLRVDPRTKGFRNQDQLAAHLESEGFVDHRQMPSPEQRRVELLDRLAEIVATGEIDAEQLDRRLSHLETLVDPKSKKRRSKTPTTEPSS